jgi:hypothetical protein
VEQILGQQNNDQRLGERLERKEGEEDEQIWVD